MNVILIFQEVPVLTADEKQDIRERAIIYRKESKRPLTLYHHRVNEAAQELCLRKPSLLMRRGELLAAAQAEVRNSGYNFKKGRSRSKKVEQKEPLRPRRQKFSKEMRTNRIKELREDIRDCNDRIVFKEKRCEAEASVKNYKQCDALTEEIIALKQQRRQYEAELKEFEIKERKFKWYLKRKPQAVGNQSSDSEGMSARSSRSITPMTSSDSSTNTSLRSPEMSDPILYSPPSTSSDKSSTSPDVLVTSLVRSSGCDSECQPNQVASVGDNTSSTAVADQSLSMSLPAT